MSNENTENMTGKRPFEERVFARFDALDSAMRDVDSRKLEIRACDTKPIWEGSLKEIVETGRELSNYLSVWIESMLSPMRPAPTCEMPKIVSIR